MQTITKAKGAPIEMKWKKQRKRGNEVMFMSTWKHMYITPEAVAILPCRDSSLQCTCKKNANLLESEERRREKNTESAA